MAERSPAGRSGGGPVEGERHGPGIRPLQEPSGEGPRARAGARRRGRDADPRRPDFGAGSRASGDGPRGRARSALRRLIRRRVRRAGGLSRSPRRDEPGDLRLQPSARSLHPGPGDRGLSLSRARAGAQGDLPGLRQSGFDPDPRERPAPARVEGRVGHDRTRGDQHDRRSPRSLRRRGEGGPRGHTSDFGQTLALAGTPSGPYVVLPLLGPSTIRDGIGTAVDGFFQPTYYILGPSNFLLGPTEILLYTGSSGSAPATATTSSSRASKTAASTSTPPCAAATTRIAFAAIWTRRPGHRTTEEPPQFALPGSKGEADPGEGAQEEGR